jgi:hypothetical protein
MHHPIRPKKRKNPGIHKIPRVSFNPVSDKIKKFITGVFDVEKPLIKPSEPKVEEEKQPKQKKDKTRYKWENYYDTDTRPKIRDDEGKMVKNPDYGVTRQRGKTKGPGEKQAGDTKWKISSWGKDKANYYQPDYPGVRTKKVKTKRTEEGDWEQKSVTRYKRSHSGYGHLARTDESGNIIESSYMEFPTRKELKAFNKESKNKGNEPIRAVRKEKSYDNIFGSGTMRQKKKLPPGKDSYVKTYYRGKLRPTIKYY